MNGPTGPNINSVELSSFIFSRSIYVNPPHSKADEQRERRILAINRVPFAIKLHLGNVSE
jgi:hypothetical protein